MLPLCSPRSSTLGSIISLPIAIVTLTDLTRIDDAALNISMYILYYLGGLITVSYGSVQILSGPQSVTNATLGGTVRFECVISSITVLPGWNINGTDYRIADLPSGYRFENVEESKVLIVSPVVMALNNSVYFCYILTYSTSQGFHRINSTTATLTIIRHIHHSSISMRATGMKCLTPQTEASTTATYNMSFSTQKLSNLRELSYSSQLIATFSGSSVGSNIVSVSLQVISPNITPKATVDNNTTDVPQISLDITIEVAVAAATFVALSIFMIIAVAVWIYCVKQKSKTDKKCQVYDEINSLTVGPPLHSNPAYEKPTNMKFEKNPAYESAYNPPANPSMKIEDPTYDTVK